MSVSEEYEVETCGSVEKAEVRGEALVCSQPISFLGQIDAETGVALEGLEIEGESVKGKILVYPTGAGSTVGSYVILNLVKNGVAPLGIINRETDTVVLSGAMLGSCSSGDTQVRSNTILCLHSRSGNEESR